MRVRLPRLAANERGAAVIELALIAPVLALMVIGIVDMSNAFSRKLALEQGAQRAIERIMQTTANDTVEGTLKTEAVCQVNGTNTNGTCKTSPITTSDVTVTYRLECVASGGGIATQTSTDAPTFDAFVCASGTASEARYIEIAVTDKYTPLFPITFSFINGDGTYHLSATAGMRTQ
ncbi:MAG: TadE/TadG family type IV pilus assembly protein [Sphingomicrobium sp.]